MRPSEAFEEVGTRVNRWPTAVFLSESVHETREHVRILRKIYAKAEPYGYVASQRINPELKLQ